MKTFTSTIASAIALSFVATSFVSARVKDEDKELLQIPGYSEEAEIVTDKFDTFDIFNSEGSGAVIDEFTSESGKIDPRFDHNEPGNIIK